MSFNSQDLRSSNSDRHLTTALLLARVLSTCPPALRLSVGPALSFPPPPPRARLSGRLLPSPQSESAKSLALTRCLCRFPPSSCFPPSVPFAASSDPRAAAPAAARPSLPLLLPGSAAAVPLLPALRLPARVGAPRPLSLPPLAARGCHSAAGARLLAGLEAGPELTIKGGAERREAGGCRRAATWPLASAAGPAGRAGAGEERRPRADAPRLPGSRAQPAAPAVAPGPRRAARAARSVSPPVCPSAEMSEVSGRAPGAPGGETGGAPGLGGGEGPAARAAETLPPPGSAKGLERTEALSPRAGPPPHLPRRCRAPRHGPDARLGPTQPRERWRPQPLGPGRLRERPLRRAACSAADILGPLWGFSAPIQPDQPPAGVLSRGALLVGGAMRRREPLRPESRASLPGSGLAGAPSWGLQPFPARGLLQPALSPHTYQLWP